MAWSYRKRIKIIPGVHLNFSKSGISTSIGVKGASITFGKSGSTVNTSIPGLGLYNRQKLTTSPQPALPAVNNPVLVNSTENIFSADVQEITSQNMQGVKDAIIMAGQQRTELKNDLTKIKASIKKSKLKLTASRILLYGLIKKSIAEKIKIDISAQQNAVSQVEQQIEASYVALDIDFDPEIKEKYSHLVNSFKQLTTSHKIWDVTSTHFQNRATTRSSASSLVSKRDVRFALKSLPDIKSSFDALYFQNANGADLYFYPSFIVMYSSKESFAIIGIDEISLSHNYVRFTKTGTVPKDSKIIDHTWLKVNKNGTQDKRFKDNYQIPVVKYGEIRLQTNTGVNEEYEFSNHEFTEQFGKAFGDYQAVIKSLKKA